MTLKKKAFKNTVKKGENADNLHFLLFPQCFLLYQKRENVTLASFHFSSANAFNLVMSKNLSFGKGLRPLTIQSRLVMILRKKAFEKKLWKKEKMLLISIFSFSFNVYYPSQSKIQVNIHIYFVGCGCFQFGPVLNFVLW